MKNELHAFDFDGTLFASPLPDTGKKIWFEKTGKEWPHKGWWSKPESLDLDVFDIKHNQEMLDYYFSAKAKSNTTVILLTSRLRQLANEILKVCKSKNIVFDHAYFKHFNLEKPDILHKVAMDGKYEIVYFYDDRQKEIDLMREFLKRELPYRLTVYHIDEATGTIKDTLTNFEYED